MRGSRPRSARAVHRGREERLRVRRGRIREEAVEAKVVVSRDCDREVDRRLRTLDARPPEPRVAVDEDAELSRAGGRLREARQQRRVVDGNRDGDPLEEAAQALQLRRPDDVEGDEDVGAAGVGHRLGLAQLLARDPDGAERELAQPRDLGAAVRLHVRRFASPCRSQCSCQRARLRSSRSTSTTAAGVSICSKLTPAAARPPRSQRAGPAGARPGRSSAPGTGR